MRAVVCAFSQHSIGLTRGCPVGFLTESGKKKASVILSTQDQSTFLVTQMRIKVRRRLISPQLWETWQHKQKLNLWFMSFRCGKEPLEQNVAWSLLTKKTTPSMQRSITRGSTSLTRGTTRTTKSLCKTSKKHFDFQDLCYYCCLNTHSDCTGKTAVISNIWMVLKYIVNTSPRQSWLQYSHGNSIWGMKPPQQCLSLPWWIRTLILLSLAMQCEDSSPVRGRAHWLVWAGERMERHRDPTATVSCCEGTSRFRWCDLKQRSSCLFN